MVKLTEELWKTLQNLREDEFGSFKWFLKQDEVLEGFSGIPVARLEKANRLDTVDLMVQKYPGPGALKVTLEVLHKISRNDLVQGLEAFRKHHYRNHEEANKAELGDKLKLMIQERQMKIEELKRAAHLSSKSADRHIADSERVFTALLQSVQASLHNLIEAISEKRETTQKRADGLIQELEQEISELTERSVKLSRTEDDLDFLKSCASPSAVPTTRNWAEVFIPPPPYGSSVGTAVNQLVEKFSKEKEKLISKAKLNRVQESARDVTLDPDTANPFLVLSDDRKQVYCGDVKRNQPDNPERFNVARNVLGKQSFSSGRFYYEVRVKGMTSWDLGVVKESIDRKGSITPKPENGFWTICLRNGNEYKAPGVNLRVKHQLQKVGVFVDYEKGSVSFYDVDSAEIIHCFTECGFTERLLPFFSPSGHQHGENSTPLIISPVSYTD
uniref:E3 ubiquitin-protein ligase TRIM21-like n=1 Tax=Scatophagus argus TaxID=75038 RepID=UPI001ED7CD1A|nr:E3 ubiquitin-protein ligase TRIM21-like [Scatophagus argus]